MHLRYPYACPPCPWCGGDLLGGLTWTESHDGTICDVRVEPGGNCCETGHMALLEDAAFWLRFDPMLRSFDRVARHRLHLEPITRKRAQAYIRQHHRHNPPPPGDKYRVACFNGPHLVGIALAGRPVARALDHRQVLEVNRCCLDHSLDQELTMHACSKLYGACRRWAARQGYSKLITYTLQDEPGTSLVAAGFDRVAAVRGRSWSCPSRPRQAAMIADRWRWEILL